MGEDTTCFKVYLIKELNEHPTQDVSANVDNFPRFSEIQVGDIPFTLELAYAFGSLHDIHYEGLPTIEVILTTMEQPYNIIMGITWDPTLTKATVKIFQEYKLVFAWTYQDLKGGTKGTM